MVACKLAISACIRFILYEKNTIPMDKKSGDATSTAYAFDYMIGAVIASQVETPYFSDHVDAVLYAPIAFGCRNLP